MQSNEGNVSQLGISINGRIYQVACDDGEEEHLALVAEYVDGQVRELSGSLGDVGEARLFLMAALLIADELSESADKIAALRSKIDELQGKDGGSGAAVEAMESAALDLESIASDLEAS